MRLITSTRRDMLENERRHMQTQRTLFAWFWIIMALLVMGASVSRCQKQQQPRDIPATIQAPSH